MLARVAFWAILFSPALIGLVTGYTPFQDWPAHLGTIGAYLHMHEPEAHILDFYGIREGWGPNRLLYYAGYLLGQVFSPKLTGMLLLAASTGFLAPAVASLCSAVGADRRLAYLALPIAIGRHVYWGFIPNAAALPPMIFAIALYLRLRREFTIKRAIALAVFSLITIHMHTFVGVVLIAVLGIIAVADLISKNRRAAAVALASSVLSFASVIPQYASVKSEAGPSLLSYFFQRDQSHTWGEFWLWLFANYDRWIIDDIFQALWLAALFGVLLAGLIAEKPSLKNLPRLVLLVLGFGLWAGYWAIPSHIAGWWGGNLRLPVHGVLLLIPAGAAAFGSSKHLPRLLAAFNLTIVLLATYDVARFGRTEMAGFDEILEVIPPGKKIGTLEHKAPELAHYVGFTHRYVSNYYLLEKGGLATSNFFHVGPNTPFTRKVNYPGHSGGPYMHFNWDKDGEPFDGFVVRIIDSRPDAPFTGALKDRVTLVKQAGHWRYYERKR